MKKIILTRYFEAIGKRYNLDLSKLSKTLKTRVTRASFQEDHFFIFLDNLYFFKKFLQYCDDSLKESGDFNLNIIFTTSSSQKFLQEIRNEFNLFLKNKKYTLKELKMKFIMIIYNHIKNNNKEILKYDFNDEDEKEEIYNYTNEISDEIFTNMKFNIFNHDNKISNLDFTIKKQYILLFDTVKHEILHFFSDPESYKEFLNPEYSDFNNPVTYKTTQILKELHALQSTFNYKEINKNHPFSLTLKYEIITNIINSLKESLKRDPTWKDFRESLQGYKSILYLFPKTKYPDNQTIISLGKNKIKEIEEMIRKASNISDNFFGNDISKIINFEAKIDYSYDKLFKLINSYKENNDKFNNMLISFFI